MSEETKGFKTRLKEAIVAKEMKLEQFKKDHDIIFAVYYIPDDVKDKQSTWLYGHPATKYFTEFKEMQNFYEQKDSSYRMKKILQTKDYKISQIEEFFPDEKKWNSEKKTEEKLISDRKDFLESNRSLVQTAASTFRDQHPIIFKVGDDYFKAKEEACASNLRYTIKFTDQISDSDLVNAFDLL